MAFDCDDKENVDTLIKKVLWGLLDGSIGGGGGGGTTNLNDYEFQLVQEDVTGNYYIQVHEYVGTNDTPTVRHFNESGAFVTPANPTQFVDGINSDRLDNILTQLTQVDENHTVTTGTNTSIPAGFKSVLINSLTGINILDFGGGNTFEIGTGRRVDAINLDATELNTKNGLLPAISISGGTWQWIVLSTLTV